MVASQPVADAKVRGGPQLTKRGTPLGNAWLAAHMERRLQKVQVVRTDVDTTVQQVAAESDGGVLALRVSGHLLLGIVRIHSRQVDYLLDDANESLVRVRLAFKPVGVDLDPSAGTRRLEEITLTVPQAGARGASTTAGGAGLLGGLDLPDLGVDVPFDTLDLPGLGAGALDAADLDVDGVGPGHTVPAGHRDGPRSAKGARGSASAARNRDITLADADGADAPVETARGLDDDFAFGRDDRAYELFAGVGGELDAEERLRRDSLGPSSRPALVELGDGETGAAGAGLREVHGAGHSARRDSLAAGGLDLPGDAVDGAGDGLGLSQLDAELNLPDVGLAPDAMPAPRDVEKDLATGAYMDLPADVGPGADVDMGDARGEHFGLGAGHDTALDAVMADAEPGDRDTPGLGLGVGIGSGDRTPSVGVRSGAKRGGGRRKRAGAVANRLVEDFPTILSDTAIKDALADTAPTLLPPAAAAPTAEGADRLARHARAIHSADPAELFAQPIFAGEAPDLVAAYTRRPLPAATAATPRRSGKRGRGESDKGADAEAAAAPAEEGEGDGAGGGPASGDGHARGGAALAAAGEAAAGGDASPLPPGVGDEQPPDHAEGAIDYPDAPDGVAAGALAFDPGYDANYDPTGGAGDQGWGDGAGTGAGDADLGNAPPAPETTNALVMVGPGSGPVLTPDRRASGRPLADDERETPEPYGVDLPVVDGVEGVDSGHTASGEQVRRAFSAASTTSCGRSQPAPARLRWGDTRQVGWSTRTRMMFNVLRKTFDERGETSLSYKALAGATSASRSRRRVVAGCFQELLFLTSHGLTRLDQRQPYGDIWIEKTGRFDSTSITEETGA